jgi:segregation and condensation protein A
VSYEVKTEVFEGPLDLLLSLITQHKLTVTDLSLTDLVTEYLTHVERMARLDMEVTSEFLLIAATLIQLKARSLLPDDEPIDIDEELALMEERDRLLARLLACATYKDVAAVLAHRMGTHSRLMPRTTGFDIEFPDLIPEVTLPVDGAGLAHLAQLAFAPRELDPDLDHLDLDLPSVPDAIDDLRSRMSETLQSEFDQMVTHCETSMEVAAYFLAALELARWGIIGVHQDHREAPIQLIYEGKT